jgi:c-di-GMP-related signal transduction protein
LYNLIKYGLKVDDYMELFIARQPIFDTKKNVFGYELLYRLNTENKFIASDGDFASASVILNCFNVIGVKKLTDNKKTFVNFTKTLLTEGIATIFPRDILVIEVLEDIHGDTQILEYCKNLKELGYEIALDDFVFNEKFLSLCNLADYIKIDFKITPVNLQKQLLSIIATKKMKLIAEKVETIEEFVAAKKLGYHYFQGYFFCRPVIYPFKDIAPLKISYLRLLEKTSKQDMDFDELSNIISQDVSLSFSLLKLINSAAFFLQSKVTSVKQALVILGENETKKWLTLIILKGLSDDPNAEIINYTLERARFMYNISDKYGKVNEKVVDADEAFFTGMLSTLDVLLNRHLDEVLSEMPISSSIKEAIINKTGAIGAMLKFTEYYQKGQWQELEEILHNININASDVLELYADAVLWSNKFLRCD